MRQSGILAFVLLGLSFIWIPTIPPQRLSAEAPSLSELTALGPLGADAPKKLADKVVFGRFDKVVDLLQRHVDRKLLAGAVALVLHRGQSVFSTALGFADTAA